MTKSKRNPPQNFTIKGGAIYLTGAKKKLSQAEEDQLRVVLVQRSWNKLLRGLGKAFQNINLTRRQSVTDNSTNNPRRKYS